MALERVYARIGFRCIGVFGRQGDALGTHDHAHGTGLAIGRAGVFGHLRDFGGDQMAVGQRANELEVQLREAQR